MQYRSRHILRASGNTDLVLRYLSYLYPSLEIRTMEVLVFKDWNAKLDFSTYG